MPRKKHKGPSLRGYFREQFLAHPDWLDLSENAPMLDQWQKDHPSEKMSERIRANLASLKSKMRSDKRDGISANHKKPGPKSANVVPASAVKEVEKLEMMIDDCLDAARALAVDRLEPVIKHLRIARAQIVLMFDPQAS